MKEGPHYAKSVSYNNNLSEVIIIVPCIDLIYTPRGDHVVSMLLFLSFLNI